MSNVLYKLNIPETDRNILKHITTIYDYINEGANYATTTKRDYLIVLSILLKRLNQIKASEYVYEQAKIYSKEHTDNEIRQTLDDREKCNYITYNELQAKLNELIEIFNNQPTLKNIIKVVVLGLYALQPPIRNDYYNMKIINDDYENDKQNNFLLIDGRSNIYVILNNDKVVKHYGPADILITNGQLKNILMLYINNFVPNNIYLFQNKNGTPYTKKQIQYVINGLFPNRTLTIYTLRSSYVCEYYRTHPRLEDRIQLADKMRHGQRTAEMSYLKFL
jgi:hypothetical protein